MYQNLMKIDGILLPALRETKENECKKMKKKRRLSKLVNTKVTTAGRQRRLRAIKMYEEEEDFYSSTAC